MKKISFAFLVVVLSAFTVHQAINWQIKEKEYAIKFETRWAEGTIKGLRGTINFDQNNLGKSSFDVTIDVKTINTGNSLKDKHAKAESFWTTVRTWRFLICK